MHNEAALVQRDLVVKESLLARCRRSARTLVLRVHESKWMQSTDCQKTLRDASGLLLRNLN